MFRVKQKTVQFPKHGKSELPYYGKSIGKRKHPEAMSFIQISREAEIHAIPNT